MILKHIRRKLFGVFLSGTLLVAGFLSGQQEVQAATLSELSAGTYSVNAGLTAAVANHGDFGAAVYSSAYITKKSDGNTYITVKFKASSMTIYGITTDVFVDVNPGTGNASRGVADGILGIYLNGSLTTTGVTYTMSSDTAVNSKGESVNYVASATFPINDGASSYNLAIYINSNTMGVEFCNSNGSATAATYPATLTIDWSSISATSTTSTTSGSSSSSSTASKSSGSTSTTAGTNGDATTGDSDTTTAESTDGSDVTTEDLTISTSGTSEEDSFTVYEAEEDTTEESANNTVLYIILGCGIVAMAGGAAYLLYRKKKGKEIPS